MIRTVTEPATSRYGAHMGTCEHFPAYAKAIDTRTGATVELTALQFPGLDEHQLAEKAVAILRSRRVYRPSAA